MTDITVSLIKYFTIAVCGFYTYAKLLYLKPSKRNIAISFGVALLISLGMYVLRVYYPALSIPLMIIFSFLFLTWTTKTQLELSITTTILSFGISNAVFAFSSILIALIFRIIGVDASVSLGYIMAGASLLQFLLIGLPFRFRRLKKGMPFLISRGATNTGVFISVILLNSVIVLSNNKSDDLIYVIPAVLILFCAVLILIWWRGRLTKAYIEKLRANEITGMQNTIQEKENRIICLEQNNEVLSKIIHKDNKLIPAMELAVRDYLQSSAQKNPDDLQEIGQALLKQLEAMSRERTGIIGDYQANYKKLPLTNICSVDALMTYMYNKAKANNIEFEMTISGSTKYMIETVISESDLSTLLADLIENAIIATKLSQNRKMLISIGIADCCYFIDVFDSGIPFEIDTIVNLGLKRITTHAQSGGSGIGMTTTFELLKKYEASLILEEYGQSDHIFTKKLSIRFDNQKQYIIKTYRYAEIKARLQREDLIVKNNTEAGSSGFNVKKKTTA